MLTVVSGEDAGRAGGAPEGSVIDEIVREGARAMLAAALRAEVAAYVEAHAGEVDEHGRRLVVRNGYAEPRQVLTSSGAVGVVAPRVDDKRVDEVTGERRRFSSAILPPWCRKSPKIDEVLPLLYLHGLSSGDFGPALAQFLGTSAGLSASVITRLTAQWQDEAKAFAARDLSGGGLRVHVGRRHPRGRPPRAGAVVPAGADRGPRRRAQGADYPGRRVPGVRRLMGGPAARRGPAWDACPGAGGRGWRARVLGRPRGGLPHHPRPALLVPQDRQRPCGTAEVRAPGGEEGPGRDLGRRGRRPRPGRCEGLRHALRGQVRQGRGEDHR